MASVERRIRRRQIPLVMFRQIQVRRGYGVIGAKRTAWLARLRKEGIEKRGAVLFRGKRRRAEIEKAVGRVLGTRAMERIKQAVKKALRV